jgi:hypothetical protein
MDRNPYDASIDWLQQSPANKQESVYTAHQQGSTQPQTPTVAKKVAPAKQARMPKQKALELVGSLKKGIVVTSVMSFGLTTSTTTTKTPITSSSSTVTATPSSSSSSTSSSSSNSSASFGTSSSQGSVSGTSVS